MSSMSSRDGKVLSDLRPHGQLHAELSLRKAYRAVPDSARPPCFVDHRMYLPNSA